MNTPRDVTLFDPDGFYPRRVMVSGPSSQRTRLTADFTDFSVLPTVVRKHPPVTGLSMPYPRVAEYFSVATAARERYLEVFSIAHGMGLAAGLAAASIL